MSYPDHTGTACEQPNQFSTWVRATWVTVGKSLVRLDAITYVSEVIDLGDCQVFFVHAGGLGLSVESSKKMSVQELNANRDALVKQLTGG